MRLSLIPIREQIQSALSKIQEIKKLNDEDPQSRTHDLMHIKFNPAPLKAHLGYLSSCTSGEDFQLLQDLTQIVNVGEVVMHYKFAPEFINLFSELQKLTEIQPESEVEEKTCKARVDTVRENTTESQDNGETKGVSHDNLDEAISVIKNGKAIQIDLSDYSSHPNWYQTVQHTFYTLSERLAGEFNFSGGKWPVFEALKNAFLHGNDLDCNLPIFLSLSTDDKNNVTSFEIYDTGEGKNEDVTRELKRMIAALGQVGGYGMGAKKIKDEWDWDIKPEAVKDDSSGKVIGKKYVYARRHKL